MVSWNDVFSVVKKSAPILGDAIASSSPIAGVALTLISKAFGANKNDPEDLLNKINADPEYQLKLTKIEYDHEESLLNIQESDYKTEVDDRKDARQRQVDLHDWVPTILAIGFLINYAAIQFYCVMYTNDSTDIISARFQDVLIMIMSYYFGSMHKRNSNVS